MYFLDKSEKTINKRAFTLTNKSRIQFLQKKFKFGCFNFIENAFIDRHAGVKPVTNNYFLNLQNRAKFAQCVNCSG